MRIVFYDLVLNTTTSIASITTEAGFTVTSDDYRFYFDKKNLDNAGAEMYIQFPTNTSFNALVLDNVFASHIYASGLTYFFEGSTYSLDLQYSSNTYTSYNFDIGSNQDTLTFDSETALLDGEEWVIGSDGVQGTEFYLYFLGQTAGNFQSFIDNVYFFEEIFELESCPDNGGYNLSINDRKIIHQIASGGIKKSSLNKVNSISLELDNVSENDYLNIKSLYERKKSFFILIDEGFNQPEFQGLCFEVNWIGDFEFNQFYNNYTENGYRGIMQLAEVPK